MNVLDENIPENQRQLLRSWGISIRQIGLELGKACREKRARKQNGSKRPPLVFHVVPFLLG